MPVPKAVRVGEQLKIALNNQLYCGMMFTSDKIATPLLVASAAGLLKEEAKRRKVDQGSQWSVCRNGICLPSSST